MKRRTLRRSLLAAGAAAALGVAGFLVAASGLVPVAASSGHWGVTEWFLRFAKKRSVATHSWGTDMGPLDEPWLVLKGAGHYETACSPCHGSPGRAAPWVARAMLPQPPDLGTRAAEWEPEELFHIVKHGLKFTGMPAWPSQHRDDEVRAMVAFLLALPALDEAAYRRLVHGDPAPAPDVTVVPVVPAEAHAAALAEARCARCHGADGRGRGSAAFPRLAGQNRDYVLRALHAYARGERHSGIMQTVVASLTADEMRALAEHYAGLPASGAGAAGTSAGAGDADAAAVTRGREIAERGIPAQGVPSCADCHGPSPTRRNPAYPSLAGQYADYLALQLELFRDRHRGGSAYAHLMDRTASRLTPEQMRDVAAYYASLAATGGASGR